MSLQTFCINLISYAKAAHMNIDLLQPEMQINEKIVTLFCAANYLHDESGTFNKRKKQNKKRFLEMMVQKSISN